MAKDPVCGSQVDEQKAPAKTKSQNKTYYFCSEACKEVFEEQHGRFTAQEQESEESGAGRRKM